MIPQRNLSLLSNRLARDGGRRIPEGVLVPLQANEHITLACDRDFADVVPCG